MTNNDLKHAFGRFEATYIKGLNIDLFNKKITLDIAPYAYEDEEPKDHQIVFQGVSAFYFSNGPDEHRFNLHTWDLIEISDLGYYKEPKDHITCVHDKPGTSRYDSDPNFNLEFWNAALLIEAKEVVIDGIIYQAR